MKKEYDFTNAQQGKFYRPIEELDMPIYLDDEIKSFFLKNMKDRASDFYCNKKIYRDNFKRSATYILS